MYTTKIERILAEIFDTVSFANAPSANSQKNILYFSDLRVSFFLLEKKMIFSFSAPPSKSIWAVRRGFNVNEAKRNYFCWRKGIYFVSALFFLFLGWTSAAQDVAGGMRGRFLAAVFVIY